MWIKCDELTRPKVQGGLGIKDIYKFNMDLLAKWKWRIRMESQGL